MSDGTQTSAQNQPTGAGRPSYVWRRVDGDWLIVVGQNTAVVDGAGQVAAPAQAPPSAVASTDPPLSPWVTARRCRSAAGKQVRDIPLHCLSLSPALPQLDRRLLRVLLCAALGARRPNRGVEQRNHHLGFPPWILDRSHHESWPGGTRCRVVTDPPRAKTGCLDKQFGTRDGRGPPRWIAPDGWLDRAMTVTFSQAQWWRPGP